MRESFDTSSKNPPPESGGGLYVHIAYCRRKCIYCDFFSAGERIADWRRYADALIAELHHRIEEMPCPLLTIYFGGGTPSLMPAAEFLRVADALKPYMSDVEEFTIEVNPDDVTEEMLRTWKRGGVNRLSLGVQSFHDKALSAIGRNHDSATAERAYRLARKYFNNISIDLIFGLPDQTLEMWKEDIRKVIEMQPEHVSAYSLMYEEGTALTELRNQGKLREASEEESEKMFEYLIESLRNAGYDHYEISNFAFPEMRSRHNSSYWLQKPYLGIGPSAHSFDGKSRRKANSIDLKGYLRQWAPDANDGHGRKYEVGEENLSDEELREEYIMTRLRTREGIPIEDFSRRFGKRKFAELLEKSRKLIDRNQLELRDENLALTESAIMMSDAIILELV